LRLQLLEVPVLDLTLETMRQSGVGDDYGITIAEMRASAEMYLPDAKTAFDPLVSPLLAPDLRGLPPAHILTAEFDPLREDGERYAARLLGAGVPAFHRRQPGAIHGSLTLTGTWQPARAWRADLISALVNAHWLERSAGPAGTVAKTDENAHLPSRGTSSPRDSH
jgi:acetyl esterase